MVEKETIIPDINNRLAENDLEVKTENPKRTEQIEESATASDKKEEEFAPDGDSYDKYLNDQVMLLIGDNKE